MKLYYYHCPTGNFGDDLNPWLWKKLIPELIDNDDNNLFVGIGTLLNHRIPQTPNKIVFGTGLGYGQKPEIDSRWRFYCVRGPLTAQALGLEPALAITDGAALVATIEQQPMVRNGGIAYIPHHQSALNADWGNICSQLGIRYIDPAWSVEKVFVEIRRSSTLLTEAMHGAILADTFRIPWQAITCYDHILDFKWADWCGSLNLKYQPKKIPPVWDAERNLPAITRIKNKVKRGFDTAGLFHPNWTPPPPAKSPPQDIDLLLESLSKVISNSEPIMSQQAVFETAVERLSNVLEKLKTDHSA